VFWPVPRVDSGLVHLTTHADPASLRRGQSRDEVFGLVDVLFGQRRKTIRHTLAAEFGPTVTEVALSQTGLAASVRPEQMALADFVALAEALPSRC
jgi:16S rRNA (adenine1518-N6/adenine1519-N6)-dimethyltransferase